MFNLNVHNRFLFVKIFLFILSGEGLKYENIELTVCTKIHVPRLFKFNF